MPRLPLRVSGLFASGLMFPVRPETHGGFMLAEGDDYVASQVLQCVMPNDSDNPFQDLGATHQAVFQNPSDPAWRTFMRQRITRQFEELERENLARLLEIKYVQVDTPGEFGMVIEYMNLEAGQQRELEVRVNSANGQINLNGVG